MDLNFSPSETEQAGRLKWQENQRFRRWLKNLNSQIVDEAADQLGRRAAAQMDCTRCAKCCQALTITPKSTDIKRLADGLELDPYQFKVKYLKKDHEGDLVFKQRPCPFLKSNRCSVYEHRPETCRSYPHLEISHMKGRGWHILENTLICPIVYNTYEMLKSHFGYIDSPEISGKENF